MSNSSASRKTDPPPPDDRAQLREQHPDAWIPLAPGDEIVGQVTDVQDAWSDQRNGGSYYPLLIIQVESATGYTIPPEGLELKVHAFGAVMYGEVLRRRPEVGERIRFRYVMDRDPTPENAALGHSPSRIFKLDVAGRTNTAGRVYDQIGKQPRRTSGAPAAAADFDPTAGGAAAGGDDVPF